MQGSFIFMLKNDSFLFCCCSEAGITQILELLFAKESSSFDYSNTKKGLVAFIVEDGDFSFSYDVADFEIEELRSGIRSMSEALTTTAEVTPFLFFKGTPPIDAQFCVN